MKSYIGTKIIQAEPMDEVSFLSKIKGLAGMDSTKNQEGYKVVYHDGYISWASKEFFENAYREITKGEKDLISTLENTQCSAN